MAEPTPPIINPSGKYQLRAVASKISAHREIISHPQFQDSINMALLNYARDLASKGGDGNVAAQNMLKLTGAQDFAQQFIYLAEPPKDNTNTKSSIVQLDHTV